MKLSNHNIYNLRERKNFWARCQMPRVGVQIISGGGHPPENPCLSSSLFTKLSFSVYPDLSYIYLQYP